MRQLILKVPEGNKEEIFKEIKRHNGRNTISFTAAEGDIFITFLPNENVNDFLKDINHVDKAEINLIPRGVITLFPPDSDVPDGVKDVQPKSALEIYLGGIQSVGSKFGLVGYSLAAGIIVWAGLYTTSIYLLVAAMLIAPFAGPAMNAAIATAAGELPLLKSSLARYGIAIGTGILSSLLMTFFLPIETLTPLMVEISQVSSVAVLLPLISGFAGGLNICQSERDSLVSGAAVGILVAASLAPPVGLIGIGLYLMEPGVIFSSLFRIILQLVGIHLAATAVFYFYGKVSPKGVRFINGRKKVSIVMITLVTLLLGGLIFWQFYEPPFLRKASLNTEFTEALNKELKDFGNITVVNSEASFSKSKKDGRTIVNFQAIVLPNDSVDHEELKESLTGYLKEELDFEDKNIYKVFQIDVVED